MIHGIRKRGVWMNRKIPANKKTAIIKNCRSIGRVKLAPQRSQRRGDQRVMSHTFGGQIGFLHFGQCIAIPRSIAFLRFSRRPAMCLRTALSLMNLISGFNGPPGRDREDSGRSGGSVLEFAAGDEACPAIEGEIGPQPLQGDDQAVAHADQKIDVGDAPDPPCDPALDPEPAPKSMTAACRPMVARLPKSR